MKDSLKGFYSTSISSLASMVAGLTKTAGTIPALMVALLIASPLTASAEEKTENAKKGPRTQQVDFEESAVNGTVRRPDGFLLNKKNDPTLSPLFNAKKNIEERIQKSHFILK